MGSGIAKGGCLFGGVQPWCTVDWTASDDRVRGGKSQSYLNVSDDQASATFTGTLDIKTLGGAGFASQRTASDDAEWDLSSYDGLKIIIEAADSMKYTLIMKDTLLPPSSNGREQSTMSYEFDFTAEDQGNSSIRTLVVPWTAFEPTYRGRKVKDSNIKLKQIRRFSIMARSFFGSQDGQFSLTLRSIAAVQLDAQAAPDDHNEDDVSSLSVKGDPRPSKGPCGSCILS